MPESFDKTFIPRRPVDPTQTGLRVDSAVDIFTAISLLVFAIVFFVSISILVSNWYVQSNIKKLSGDVTSLASNLDASQVADLVSLDKQVSAVTEILNNHTSISSMFSFLERTTVNNVSLIRATLERDSSNIFSLKIDGATESYNALANQQVAYKNNTMVSRTSFSEIRPDETGYILFKADLNFTPETFIYKATN